MLAVGTELNDTLGPVETTTLPHHVGASGEGKAPRGSKAEGHERHAVMGLHVQAALGLGKHHGLGNKAQTYVEDLARDATLWGVVVKEHHAITDGHGPSRPGKDRPIPDKAVDVEDAQAVDEDGDVAACDGDADAIFQLFLQIVALALNRCPLGDLQANIELGAHCSRCQASRLRMASIDAAVTSSRMAAGVS